MIQEKNNLWREGSNFIGFQVNFHASILGFVAKIRIGEKVRFSEQCALHRSEFEKCRFNA